MRFDRFPSIPHLAWLGESRPREDKVLSRTEADLFLAQDLIVEEKVDGANLGLSFDPDGNIQVQNRGGYLPQPWAGQFSKLDGWLQQRGDALFDALSSRYVLFGEWCAVRHTVAYDRLPDWFLAFDLYDRTHNCFLAPSDRASVVSRCSVALVAEYARGRYHLSQLTAMLSAVPSHYCAGLPEGLMLRPVGEIRDPALPPRAKLVRAEFLQSIDGHWRNRIPEPNRLGTWTKAGGMPPRFGAGGPSA